MSNLSCNSEDIIKDSFANKIIVAGTNNLKELSSNFVDSSVSKVYSKCTNRFLQKGEVALILADHIKRIPYFSLIGLQNCTFETCEKNPNTVEYYLEFMKSRGMLKDFHLRYNKWLRNSVKKKYRKNKN